MSATLQRLLRPELRGLGAYAAASPARELLRLHANEAPCAEAVDSLSRYPCPQPAGLLARLAEAYDVDSSCVLATRGSDDAIDLLVRCFCRAGTDQVLVCPPTFGMYEMAARLQGATVVRVPLDEAAGFRLDEAALVAATTADTRLVFLCSPNNPTGNVTDPEVVLSLAHRLRRSSLVVLDEAYIEFSGTRSLASEVSQHENLVVLRTLSKAYALAGARCGALVANPALLQLVRPALPPYPLSTLTVQAAEKALEDSRFTERIALVRGQRSWLSTQLARLPSVIRCWPSNGNFLLLEVPDAGVITAACRSAGILIRDLSGQPGLRQHVRVSVGTPDQNRRLVAALGGVQ